MYGTVVAKLHVFLTLALDKCEEQVSHSGRLSSDTNRKASGGNPQPIWTWCRREGHKTLHGYVRNIFSRNTNAGLRKSFSVSSSHLNPTFLITVVKDKFVPFLN
jgi:hypothetical protein